MTQEIKFSGLAAIPDDYQSPDGQLDASLNLICEDAHLKALHQPSKVCQLPERCRVVFIHKTSAFTHYIVYEDNTDMMSNGETLHWIGEEDIHSDRAVAQIISGHQQVVHDYETHPVIKVTSIGNTLEVLTDECVHYSLWKGNEYLYLGSHMPELPLSFGLQGETKGNFRPSTAEKVYLRRNHEAVLFSMPSPDDSLVFPESTVVEIDYLTEQVLAQANKFIAEEGTEKGKFVFPFFVRYAYRLYDGNITMHSVPVLLTTNSHLSPELFIVSAHNSENDNGWDYLYTRIGGLVYDLDYICIDPMAKETLLQWGDIIKSVDIFVSAPIYTYNQAGKVDTIINWPASRKGRTKALIPSNGDTLHLSHSSCADIIFKDLTGGEVDYDYGYNGGFEFQLPMHSADEVFEAVSGCSNFYLLKSIAVADIATSRTVVKVPENYLQSLTSRELMTEDNGSHNTLVPSYMTNLNSRLLMANITKHAALPLPAAYYTVFYESTPMFDTGVYVYMEKDGTQYVVRTPLSSLGYDLPFDFFYYPDSDAYKVVFYHERNGGSKYFGEVQLKKHDFLPGAFCCMMFDPDFSVTQLPDSTEIDESGDIVEQLPNKVYNSEVNNPFFFPVTGINTIGTGTINGIATVTEPLSQGQFGYADIYVFCSDGIWVAKINQQGKISNINPVNKDVCTNPKSITQLGSSVLYVTQRGIMQLYGRNIECISDVIANEHPFNHLTNLPKLDSLNTNLPTIAPFSDFLSNCQMLYDYIHQRIIVYNSSVSREVAGSRVVQGVYDPETGMYDISRIINSYKYSRRYNYAYVFSLRSKLWGMMQTDLLSSLNSYPEALAMAGTLSNAGIESDTPAFSSLNLVSFDNPVTTNPVDGIAITRPIKFGSPDTLKSVYELIQRGVFNRGDVKTILYGSRDLEHWYLIASSTSHAIRGLRGTPYKYFRLVAVSSLADNQSLAGTTFVVEPRHIHQLH